MSFTSARHAAAQAALSDLEIEHFYLPAPPSDAEKYSYMGKQRRWPFVWLFVSQAILIAAYVLVMIHNPITSIGLVLLTFMVPPTLVNFWLRIKRRRISLADHLRTTSAHLAEVADRSVDVFIPCCGEDPRILDNTFTAVVNLQWSGELRVFVLDDADDEATRELAAHHGLRYVVRSNRGEWKKAGNMINAFEQTSGQFIAVFDADFAPRPDFLSSTVPYMSDPRIGVVQTAQYFDVDKRVNEFGRFAGALQELFFRWIQPARDRYDAAICAGTNVVYRRAAVEAAGGFARVPLGEDVHSGVKIWVANFRTRYVPIVLAKGVAPDTWKGLTNQQYRWCRSSMLLMRSTFFRDAPFSFRQRLCYWAAFLYYMASAAALVTASLPSIIMLWMYPDEIRDYYYWPVIPAIAALVFVFPRIARGWRPAIIRVSAINSLCHLLAVWDALTSKVRAWVPTGIAVSAVTGGRGVPDKIASMGRIWFVATQSLLWGGVARFILAGNSLINIWPLVALAAFQLWMLAPVLRRLGPTDQGDAERRPRSLKTQQTTLEIAS